MSSGQKPVRKFPPPCWTRDEALELIEAYSERWHALNRAFLRNPDWDAVAEKLTTAFPDVTPPKTAAQCRHKMEKLRQRHRAEKQRAAGFAGEQFFSTWFYYEAMEAMENGSKSEPGSNPDQGVRVKPIAVQKFETLPNPIKNRTKPNPNFNSRVSNLYPSYPGSANRDVGSFDETRIQETLIPNNHKKSLLGGGINGMSGIRIKPSMTRLEESESGRPGLRPRKFSKVIDDDEEDDEMWMKVPRSANSLRGRLRNEKSEKRSIPNGTNAKKKKGGMADVVGSIRLLGEGFMKVEKMKIDMFREIEEMRMESEMKRIELMLESQKNVVEAFVEGLVKYRKVPTRIIGDV